MKRRAGLLLAMLMALGCAGPTKNAEPASPADPPLGPTPGPDPVAQASAGESPDVKAGIQAFQANDLPGAKQAFDAALKKNPEDADALYYEGLTADKTGDKPTAEKYYKSTLKLRPGHESAASNLSALYDDAQRYDDAIAVAKATLARGSGNAALYANLGLAYAGKTDAPQAIHEFDQAVKISSNDAALRLTYAHALLGLNQPDAAVAQLRAAVPLAGSDLGLLAALGHEQHVVKAFTDCIATFDKAVLLKDASELRTERAACKLGAKDDDGAIADLKAAVANEPSYVPAHYYLANALASGGKAREAIAEFQAFLKLQPSGPMAKAANEKIKRLRTKSK